MSDKQVSQNTQNDARYRIGAVSRLTGVPTDTLRVWERRYTVVEPKRTEGGSRLYSQEDVVKLGLIKRLVNAGHAIGTVANLSLEQLEQRAMSTQLPGQSGQLLDLPTEPLNVVVIGATLAVRLQASFVASDSALNLVAAYERREDLNRIKPKQKVDILILELATLNRNDVANLQHTRKACAAQRLIVVYGYGETATLGLLKHLGITALRLPVTWEDLSRHCVTEQPPARPATNTVAFENAHGTRIPDRLFTDQQLAKVSTASVTVKCECPHHLADLLVGITRFEQYSAECENRNESDAAVHAYLHATTAHVRATLETALHKLVQIEGLDITPIGPAVKMNQSHQNGSA